MDKKVMFEIEEIVKKIKNEISTNEIILFGSQSNGTATADSDIDLCIITKDNNERKIDLIRRIRRTISPYITMPVDILVFEKEEFEKRASLNSTFEFKLKSEGKKIYEQ